RSSACALFHKSHCHGDKQTAKGELDNEINRCGNSKKRGQPCDYQEQEAKEHTLTSAALAAPIVTRKHSAARTRIVIPVHPADRKEMRQLPQQKDRQKTRWPCPYCSARSRPTDQWRY